MSVIHKSARWPYSNALTLEGEFILEKMPKLKKISSFKQLPTEICELEKMGNEFVEFCKHPDVFTLDAYAIVKGISSFKWRKIAEENPFIAECFACARHILATKLTNAVLSGRMTESYMFRMLPLYDMEFRALLTERYKQAQNSESHIVVYQDVIENSPLVIPKEITKRENSH
jgi:hypothetical protein